MLLLAACDPVHGDARDALGGETPGVRTGPTHRPGQPCLICHDGSLGNPSAFTVAGTVFTTPTERVGLEGVQVTMTDARNSTFIAETNSAGNFYITDREWTPTYPMTVVITNDGTRVEMKTHVGRDGSCGGCHVDPASASSPGHIYLTDPTDAGVK
jgi:hypothetical protein